jgi:hypothetical protein
MSPRQLKQKRTQSLNKATTNLHAANNKISLHLTAAKQWLSTIKPRLQASAANFSAKIKHQTTKNQPKTKPWQATAELSITSANSSRHWCIKRERYTYLLYIDITDKILYL